MKLAILCSGQVGQQRNMLDEILADPACAAIINSASEVLGLDLASWWFKLEEQELFLNANAQFAIAIYQLATFSRIKTHLPEISMVVGYSVGELLAYFVAGALNAQQTLRLVRERARLMDQVQGGMLLWRGRASPATVLRRDRLMAEYGLVVAIKRRQGELVLAGSRESVSRFISEMHEYIPGLVALPVTIPSHTPYLAGAAQAFREILSASEMTVPKIPLLSAVDGMPVRTRDAAIDALSRQMESTIRWDACMAALRESGVTAALELGPGNDLAKLLLEVHPRIMARSVGDFHDFRKLSEQFRA